MRSYFADIVNFWHPSALNALLLLLSSEFLIEFIRDEKNSALVHIINSILIVFHAVRGMHQWTEAKYGVHAQFFMQLIHVYEMIYDLNFNNLFL